MLFITISRYHLVIIHFFAKPSMCNADVLLLSALRLQ